MPRSTKDSQTRRPRKSIAVGEPLSPHRGSRCGICYWALYDGDWCQNQDCVMRGKSVNSNRVHLTNWEAQVMIEARDKLADVKEKG